MLTFEHKCVIIDMLTAILLLTNMKKLRRNYYANLCSLYVQVLWHQNRMLFYENSVKNKMC